MNEAEQIESKLSTQIENARIGYQMAIELWAHSGDEVWARFNVMLVANSIVIAVVGVGFSNQNTVPNIAAFLSVVGIVLCLLWLTMMKRGFDYQLYYILCARELEENYLAGAVQTLSRGALFASGKVISIQTNKGPITRRMSFWSRLLMAQSASYAVILFFVVVYVAMLLQSTI